MLITSNFKPGNMLICCGELYLDMVGPVPGSEKGDHDESICKRNGIFAVPQDTTYLMLHAWQYVELLWETASRQSQSNTCLQGKDCNFTLWNYLLRMSVLLGCKCNCTE
jgi:hypothetical protein